MQVAVDRVDRAPRQFVVVGQIFRPGFSTVSTASEHGGRGVGLDVVVALVRQLGARLLVSSRRGEGTELRVRLQT
jgi:chemotaxis protein histidine kinase CheA